MDETVECDVGAVSDFPPGSVNLVKYEEEPVALFNVDGDFYALADTCSHGNAPLSDGDVFGLQVECPWHFGRFDLTTGKACKFPAKTPVRTFQVRLIQDRVLISTRSSQQRGQEQDDEAVA